MRTIHHTIRDSLRRMCLPSAGSTANKQTTNPHFATLGSRSISMVATNPAQRGHGHPSHHAHHHYDGVIHCDNNSRRSADRDSGNRGNHSHPYHMGGGGELCARSHTLTDLNQIATGDSSLVHTPSSSEGQQAIVSGLSSNASRASNSQCVLDLKTLEAHNNSSALRDSWPAIHGLREDLAPSSPNASESTLSSGERSSARLVHSSHRADVKQDTDTVTERPSSPIWKPRSHRTSQQLSYDSTDSYERSQKSGYDDCSEMGYEDRRYASSSRFSSLRGQQADC